MTIEFRFVHVPPTDGVTARMTKVSAATSRGLWRGTGIERSGEKELTMPPMNVSRIAEQVLPGDEVVHTQMIRPRYLVDGGSVPVAAT
jgi:hypothetical protein